MAVTQNGVNNQLTPTINTISNGSTFTPLTGPGVSPINYQNNSQGAATLTMAAPSGTAADGQLLLIRLKSTSVQTFSWNSVYQASTDLALPTVSSSSSKYDYVLFIYNSVSSKWDILAANFGH